MKKVVNLSFSIALFLSCINLFVHANEEPWQEMSPGVMHGFVSNEQLAAKVATLVLSSVYEANFIVQESLSLTLERGELDERWLVYGKLATDLAEDSPKLLAIIDKNSAQIVGITNFIKNKNPYSNFIIPSNKKGYIANKKIALDLAELLLKPIYGEQITDKSKFKASLKKGVWHIWLANKKEDVPLMKMDQRDGTVLGITFRLNQLQQF